MLQNMFMGSVTHGNWWGAKARLRTGFFAAPLRTLPGRARLKALPVRLSCPTRTKKHGDHRAAVPALSNAA